MSKLPKPKFVTLIDEPKVRILVEKYLAVDRMEDLEKLINTESDAVKTEFTRWKAEKGRGRNGPRAKRPQILPQQAARQNNPLASGINQQPWQSRSGTPNCRGRSANALNPSQQFTQSLPPNIFQIPSTTPYSYWMVQHPLFEYGSHTPPNVFHQPPPSNQNVRAGHSSPRQPDEIMRNLLDPREVDEYMKKTLKDTDLTWTFSFPQTVVGLILGKKYAHVNKYSTDNYVDVRIISQTVDPVTLKIDGSGTSLENVHAVCMDIWKRLSTNEHCETKRASRELENRLKSLRITKFQQLLFMEDFQIGMIKEGQSWKFVAFSTYKLEQAVSMLGNITRFRQNAPKVSFASLSSFSSTLTLNSSGTETTDIHLSQTCNTSVRTVVQAPPKPEPGKKFLPNKKTKKVYNAQTFHTPGRAIFIDEDSIGNSLKKTTNILLLGQSGVGKSTFLNAFGNYLEFGNNFKKAEQNLKVYIPAKYDLAYDDIDRDPLTVELKPSEGFMDNNEVFDVGKSATQEARCYTFQYGTGANQKEVRVIDTPGLVDTGGMEQDQINIARTLKCIKQFPTLQAIVFLLRHDESRATASLQYNLTESLKRLHYAAAKNILFVFPKTDPAQPPHTIQLLKGFFEKIGSSRKEQIIMNPKTTVFRLDNFGFLYLGGRKYANYQEMGAIRQKAEKCWDCSAKDVENLLKAISTLPDYHTEKTLEIQDTKICLEAFAHPMADLSRQILNNQTKLWEKEVEINQLLKENKDLVGRLDCDQKVYVRRPLDTPRLCCYSDTCATVYTASDPLPRICHDSCHCLPEKDRNEETGKALLACEKFNKLEGRCTSCNCGLNTHRMVNFDVYESTKKVVSVAVTDTARANQTERDRASEKCAELRSENLTLQQSLEKLRKNGAMFAAFIKQNSLHGEFHDSFEHQLKQCIQVTRNNGDEKTLESLEKFTEHYIQEKSLFDLAHNQETVISYADVLRKLRELEQDEGIGEQVQEYTKMIGIYTDEDVPEEKKAIIESIFDRLC